MEIPRDKIIEELRSKGEHELAEKAKIELPAMVDHSGHADLLKKVGIDPNELVGSGAAADDLPAAVGLGLDAFLTGEPAERCMAIRPRVRDPLPRGRPPRHGAPRGAAPRRAHRRRVRRHSPVRRRAQPDLRASRRRGRRDVAAPRRMSGFRARGSRQFPGASAMPHCAAPESKEPERDQERPRMPTVEEISSWSGRTAVGPDGEKVGKIDHLYLDRQTGEPTFAAVKTGLLGPATRSCPSRAPACTRITSTSPTTGDTIKAAPSVEADGELSEAEEATLYEHYAIAGYSQYDGPDHAVLADYDRTRGTVGHDTSGPNTDDAITRSEEELRVGVRSQEVGRARLRKYVVTEHVTTTVPVQREEVRIEREPITDANRDAAFSGRDISEEEHEVTLHPRPRSCRRRSWPRSGCAWRHRHRGRAGRREPAQRADRGRRRLDHPSLAARGSRRPASATARRALPTARRGLAA